MSLETQERTPLFYLPEAFIKNRKIVFIESIIILVLLWALLANGLNMSDTLSSPWLVLIASYELIISMEWVSHLIATLRRVFIAFVITMLVGSVLGIAMGVSTFIRRMFQDYVTVGMAFPSLFFAVFSAMWFGVGDLTPIAAASISGWPIVTLTIQKGVENIDSGLIDMSKSFEVSRSRTLNRVVVKSVLPEWFSGVRYAFSGSWKLVTLGELIAAQNGVGFKIQEQMKLVSLTGVLTWTLLFTVVILVIEYGIFQQIEKRVFAWRQEGTIGWG